MNQHIPKGLSIVLVSSIASLGLGLGPAFADNLEKPANLQEQSSLLAQVSTNKQNPAVEQSSTAEPSAAAELKARELNPTADEKLTSTHSSNSDKTLANVEEKSYSAEQTKRSKRSISETEAAHEEVSFAGEWFYTQLNPDEQSAYRQLRAQATTSFNDAYKLEDIEVSLPENSSARLDKVSFAFFKDHPEYFWVAQRRLAWERNTQDQNKAKLVIRYAQEGYFEDGFNTESLPELRKSFNAKLDEIIQAAPQDEEQKLLYFNNWLALNNTYNKHGLSADNRSRVASSAILSNNSADLGPVCYGYTAGLKVLLDRAGFENVFVDGWAYNDKNMPNGEQHAWNLVKLKGKWYAIDATWDDPGITGAGARRVFHLVGADTLTNPTLAQGKQRFSENHIHDASRGLSLKAYGLQIPQLEHEGLAKDLKALELIDQTGSSQSFDSFKEALEQAKQKQGSTIRLWAPVSIDESLELPDGLRLDLNGQDQGFRTAAINKSSGTIFRIPPGASVELLNSSNSQGSIETKGTEPVIDNQGTLILHPKVQLKSRSNAISGNEPQAADFTFIPKQTSSIKRVYSAWQITQPIISSQETQDNNNTGVGDKPASSGSEAGTEDNTSPQEVPTQNYEAPQDSSLTELKAAFIEPKVQWSYYMPLSQSTIKIPDEQIPRLNWQLVEAPNGVDIQDESSKLKDGRYLFEAQAYGYTLLYAIQAKLDAPKVDTPEVSAPDVENPDVDTPDVENPDANAPEAHEDKENSKPAENEKDPNVVNPETTDPAGNENLGGDKQDPQTEPTVEPAPSSNPVEPEPTVEPAPSSNPVEPEPSAETKPDSAISGSQGHESEDSQAKPVFDPTDEEHNTQPTLKLPDQEADVEKLKSNEESPEESKPNTGISSAAVLDSLSKLSGSASKATESSINNSASTSAGESPNTSTNIGTNINTGISASTNAAALPKTGEQNRYPAFLLGLLGLLSIVFAKLSFKKKL